MKKWAGILIVVFLIVGGVYFLKKTEKAAKKFAVTEQKPFVVIIPSYNNSDWCEWNLRSVFMQKYDNYRVIYINDASKDDTLEKVKGIVKKWGQEKRVQIIDNPTNQGAAANFYRAIHSCRDDEIIINCDGDDWFLHDHVLKKLNEVYVDADVWLTYGSYYYFPSFTKGECSKPIPLKILNKKQLRPYLSEKGFVLSHLRTYYAGLFKQIKLEDFLFEGRFFPASPDAAMMIPMVEMAKEHARFLKTPLYVNNRANALNEDKVRKGVQLATWEQVQHGKPYDPVPSWRAPKGEGGECIIFSFDRPMQLYALLESMQKNVKNLSSTQVLYRTSNQEFDRPYQEVASAFPHVKFVKQGADPSSDFKSLLLQMLKRNNAQYVMFAVDDMILKDEIDIKDAIAAMQATHAYGFYFRLGNHVTYSYADAKEQGVPKSVKLKDDLFAWQFAHSKWDWHYPHTVDMTLYRKADILPKLEKMKYTHPGTLEAKWARHPDFNKVGLYYDCSKVVTIPINVVIESNNRRMKSFSVQQLLQKFQEGLKIDIAPLHQINNRSAHMEIEPTFIKR